MINMREKSTPNLNKNHQKAGDPRLGVLGPLTFLLLFVITAPFVHSRIKNLTNVYIFGLGVLAIIATYFVGGNTFIPDDPSLYQSKIISELNIGDISQVKYGEPKRFFYDILRSG